MLLLFEDEILAIAGAEPTLKRFSNCMTEKSSLEKLENIFKYHEGFKQSQYRNKHGCQDFEDEVLEGIKIVWYR